MSITYYPHQALSLIDYMTLDNYSPPGLSVPIDKKKREREEYTAVSQRIVLRLNYVI